RKKNLNPDKIVSTFIMGTRQLYDWVDENPMISMHRENYVNDPNIIAQNDNMISINSALQVDCMGQVAADMLGPQQFSGVGGQVDFVRGAYRSKNGKSIIALPSTAAGGTISRIAATLDLGACVTTSRFDVQYVVTEYGIAHLKHHTVRERMEALINIAHPDFRSELREQAKKVYYR
ncbi:MAG: acetyl-CoA hydrolase/transferase family protein, partial [Methylocystaceae bacterium]